MHFDCIVIGGGAAGMTAAITAARRGKKTAIIEHTDRIGKKILSTGNGKCNLTNTELDRECYQSDDGEFVMQVIDQFTPYDVIDFFKCLGIYPKSKNGYIYPNSEQASSVLDVLRLELSHQKVALFTQTIVKGIEKNGEQFRISTEQNEFTADSLILATGSKAAPKTGSDGSGYKFAKKLGHSVIKPLPALVQLRSDLDLCKGMAGVRSEGKVDLYIDGQFVTEDTGEVQYTDYGVSGIPVFQISRYAVRAVDAGNDVYVDVDMLPSVKDSALADMLFRRLDDDGYKTIEQFLMGLLNKKLVNAVLKRNKINPNETASNLKEQQMQKIINTIKKFRIPVSGYNPFENGQICSGGVRTNEINAETMESKILDHLYFAGEMVDVDGKCGGYNLQWAWSSGHVAGSHA